MTLFRSEIRLPFPSEKIVIVGAGQAGGRAAEALRANGFAGAITVIGDEPHPPYERPQLSKAMLATRDAAATYLRPSEDWRQSLDVNLVTATSAVACDADRRIVTTADGRDFAYERLLLATGTRPRCLAVLGDDGPPRHYLRNIEDAVRFRQRLQPQARIVIIGGGVIGLEAACAAVKHGCIVTVIEAEQRLLTRAFPAIVSDVVAAAHRDRGVEFIFGATVVGSGGSFVRLGSGREIPADEVLVGIGVEPADAIARQIGLSVDGGIAVDARGQTAAPDVYCAGDAALQWSRCHDRAIRVETWANAQNQAINVAKSMVGQGVDYVDPPWFWSDQYDLNIQVVGDLRDADLIQRGRPDDRRFSVMAMRDGNLVGAICINAAKDMAMLRRLVAQQARVTPGDLESPQYDLRRALK
ncbi:MAG: FAD-dependent oxidoreductase [Rhizobiales bacterium]|nr:FAD-dependent oxidoreductase [Hyphomicrobiales bacterium]